MASAAIFDLDRTLLLGSSAKVFRKHLAQAGLTGDGEIPLSDVLGRVYEQFGENWLLMQPARLAARAAAGWAANVVAGAMEAAAADLEELVLPFGAMTIEEQRQAGRLLVMATTTVESVPVPASH